ncbi:MAG: hypothetical protein U1E51_16965 [Candidatus Binatia bacterium]|nr:hypothetical protein [Candidatus Binatia bacterium]
MIPQLEGLNRQERRALAIRLNRENAYWPIMPVKVERNKWPASPTGSIVPFEIWRSRDFLIQAFAESYGIVRLSINRTLIDPDTGRWHDDISWDELQSFKNWIGYSGQEAVEVYPPKHDEVNIANLRHLWVLPERLAFSWRKG